MKSFDAFRRDVTMQLEAATGMEDVESTLQVPKRWEFGDLTTNVCFALKTTMKKDPSAIATEIAAKLKASGSIGRIEAKGPYINFFMDERLFIDGVLSEATKENYGSEGHKEGTVVVEYSSPNIAKPFSAGHLRATIIGDSIYRCHTFLGYKCVRINHLGDWGTQFGKLITAYKRWGSKEALDAEPIKESLRLYVRFHEEAERDQKLEDDARAWFKKLEDGDEEATKLWEMFKSVSMDDFKRLYAMLGVEFDEYTGESFYAKENLTNRVVAEAENKGVAIRDNDGSLVIKMDDAGLGVGILVKSDGATIYLTRDIAAAEYRWEKYQFTKNIYVVGAEQEHHFKQLFEALKRMGHDWAQRCHHVAFGLIVLPEGKMSTRKGRVIFMEDVLDKAIALVGDILDEKNPSLDPKKRAGIAKSVGIGAIKFADLSQDRRKTVTFDWNRILDTEGDTGPYVQYAFARTSKILKKAGTFDMGKISPMTHQNERKLLHTLSQFPEVVHDATEKFHINEIANHLIDVCHAFSRFYETCPVISAPDEDTRNLRLALTLSTRNVLGNGLKLLGMDAIEDM